MVGRGAGGRGSAAAGAVAGRRRRRCAGDAAGVAAGPCAGPARRLRPRRRRVSARSRHAPGGGGSRSFQPRQDRRGDEDRRVGAGEQADEQREAEVPQRERAVDPHADDEQRATGSRATNEVFNDRISTSLSERFAIVGVGEALDRADPSARSP